MTFGVLHTVSEPRGLLLVTCCLSDEDADHDELQRASVEMFSTEARCRFQLLKKCDAGWMFGLILKSSRHRDGSQS
jgi:hypothetical protein